MCFHSVAAWQTREQSNTIKAQTGSYAKRCGTNIRVKSESCSSRTLPHEVTLLSVKQRRQQEGSAACCRMMAWPARDNRATLTAPASRARDFGGAPYLSRWPVRQLVVGMSWNWLLIGSESLVSLSCFLQLDSWQDNSLYHSVFVAFFFSFTLLSFFFKHVWRM
jgi:hypothetical protein